MTEREGVQTGDVLEQDLGQNKYDCVVAIDVLTAYKKENIEKMISKMHNATKPGGKIIFTVRAPTKETQANYTIGKKTEGYHLGAGHTFSEEELKPEEEHGEIDQIPEVQKIIDDDLAEIVYNHQVAGLEGDKILESAVLEDVNTHMKREIEIDKCILAVGMTTNLDIFEDLGIETEGKYIRVDKEMRTNVEGVFAIGDIATQYQLIVIAVAQGAKAAHNAFGMIRKPYWYKDEPWPTEGC